MKKKGYYAAGAMAMAATAFLWSIAGLFIKAIDWHPLVIAGMRSLIASFVILAYLRRPNLSLSPPQVAAGVANAATMLLFVSANKTTTAANAILLQYIAPVFTAILAALILKERPRAEHWIALPLVIVGLIVMLFNRLEAGRHLGNTLALLSGVSFSLFFIFMRMQKRGSPLESILLSHWIAASVGIIACFFVPAPVITARSLAAIAVLGIVQIGISAVLFSVAIRRISATSASIIALIEPVCNPVWVFLVLGEAPGVHALIGGGMILAAVTGASIVSSRRNE